LLLDAAMDALLRLLEDHRFIERVAVRALEALDRWDAHLLAEALEFFDRFVEQVHHAKEEQVLFEALVSRSDGLARGPIAVMEKEHAMCRAYLESARSSLPAAIDGMPEAKRRVERSVRQYVELIRVHIHKEDAILYPVAERMLPAELDAELTKAFARIEAEMETSADDLRWEHLLEGRIYEPTMVVRRRHVPRTTEPVTMDARTLAADDEEPAEEDTAPTSKVGMALYDRNGHRDLVLHDFGRGLAVQANQFLIVNRGEAMILDPGGPKIYPSVFAETMLHVRPESLRYVFLSHQDPDIGTSLNAWLMDTKADAYVSRLWVRFLPHFGIDRLLEDRLKPIPDEGMVVHLGGAPLILLPAHFLHSPGNFHVYDPTSKILFSGDLAGSMGAEYSVVPDFDAHVRFMKGFHQRYMASKSALRGWVEMVRTLDVETIAPQHGAMLRGKEMVQRFLDWCSDLPCGVDLYSDRYRVPRG
jgi:hemerythrin-like domain-containing protein/glyoxylase-like metal-dependent hydrolase (beta-lactamase superfamily II)